MIKSISLIAVSMAISFSTLAQGYNVSFSEEIKLRGKDRAYTQDIIGEDEDYLFVLLTDKYAGTYSSNQIYIQKVDKKTLKPKQLKGIYNDNLTQKDFPFKSLFNTEDGFVVFFENSQRGKNEVYAMRLDNDLNLSLDKKLIYSYNEKEEDIRIVSNSKSNDFVLLSQKYVEEGQQIKVVYTAFDEEFFQIHSNEIRLDIYSKIKLKKAAKRAVSVLEDFNYTSKGELISLIRVTQNDSEKELFELSFVNTNTGDSERLPVLLKDDAYFADYKVIINENELILSGFYSNAVLKSENLLSKKKVMASDDLDGTFFQRYNIKDRMLLSSSQVPFDSEFMNYIAENNPATNTWLSNLFGNSNKSADDVSGKYRIQNVIYDLSKNYATFYCEYVENTIIESTRTANGITTTTYSYRTTRGNLFYYRISLEDGKMLWFNSIRKFDTYSSPSSTIWNTITMDVFPKEGGDLIFYSTQRIFNENDRSDLKGEKINTKNLNQNYFTAQVFAKDGSFETSPPSLAPTKLKQHFKIQLDEKLRSEYGRSYYTLNSTYTLKPGLYPLYLFLGTLKSFGVEIFNETYTVARIDY